MTECLCNVYSNGATQIIPSVGRRVGLFVGRFVGAEVGSGVGAGVGSFVGCSVGLGVGALWKRKGIYCVSLASHNNREKEREPK